MIAAKCSFAEAEEYFMFGDLLPSRAMLPLLFSKILKLSQSWTVKVRVWVLVSAVCIICCFMRQVIQSGPAKWRR
jgi:hypothetical protein